MPASTLPQAGQSSLRPIEWPGFLSEVSGRWEEAVKVSHRAAVIVRALLLRGNGGSKYHSLNSRPSDSVAAADGLNQGFNFNTVFRCYFVRVALEDSRPSGSY